MTKKILISALLSILLASFAFADGDNKLAIKGIEQYKKGNYLGTIQTMEEVIDSDPGNALAYYYIAISYVQLGDQSKALAAYDTVIMLSSGSQLAKYAQIGKKVMFPQAPEIDISENKKEKNISEKFYSENVEKDMESRNLKFLIEKINRNKTVDPSEYQKFEDFTPDKSHSGMPDNQEIAQALQTLQRAGINPFNGYSKPAINPEMMQMSMLGSAFGGMGMGGQQNSNPVNNILPMLMMMQANKGQNSPNNVDPQFMQSMLTNMMMPNMADFTDRKDY